jgi:hypothetical protein
METGNEIRSSGTSIQITEASTLYNEKVSKYIKTLLNERARIKSKNQKTALLSVILSSFFIFDLIPCILPTILFISIEPFSHLYQAIIWPILSKQQKMYLYSIRIFIRIPYIVKTTPIIAYILRWLFRGVSNITIAYQLVLSAWFLTFTIFFILLPWSISNYLLKNGYYQGTFLAHALP